jgi:hypothetical protein
MMTLETNSIEVLWIECNSHDNMYYIAGCYHPPKARYSDSALMSELAGDLERLACLFPPVIIVIAGDFNSFGTSFLETDFGLEQLVDTPTHCSHIIDKFFPTVPISIMLMCLPA